MRAGTMFLQTPFRYNVFAFIFGHLKKNVAYLKNLESRWRSSDQPSLKENFSYQALVLILPGENCEWYYSG